MVVAFSWHTLETYNSTIDNRGEKPLRASFYGVETGNTTQELVKRKMNNTSRICYKKKKVSAIIRTLAFVLSFFCTLTERKTETKIKREKKKKTKTVIERKKAMKRKGKTKGWLKRGNARKNEEENRRLGFPLELEKYLHTPFLRPHQSSISGLHRLHIPKFR